jgi:hypothetical protein
VVTWRIADGLVWLETTGKAVFEDFRAALENVRADAAYRAGMGIVHDWRNLTESPSRAEIEARARYAKTFTRVHTKWAVVATTDATYGMSRMGEVLSYPAAVELATFRDVAKAEAWIRSGE